MSKRYSPTFEFADTEAEARALVARLNDRSSSYIRKNKPAHYTPWEARDKDGNVTESKFIVWYWA